ncbi:hypothetical protein [Erythrobacter sp.]|uniref:hypothetical protein n=1 Tax=Erythrobacter sp. TaxID=1042 RepID=UPI003C717E4F
MKISFDDVADRFENVLTGHFSRMDADRWAWQMVQADNSGSLQFIPAADRPRILRGLNYLLGIDLRSAPNTYLHTAEDIRHAYQHLKY